MSWKLPEASDTHDGGAPSCLNGVGQECHLVAPERSWSSSRVFGMTPYGVDQSCEARPMGVSAVELALRNQIMAALQDRADRNGGVVTRDELSPFKFGQHSVRLIDTNKGIWNPQAFDVTLSIISDPESEYGDEFVDGGLLKYRYQRGPIDGANTKLRRAAATGVPLILLRKIANGVFVPVAPVYVVADDPTERAVLVAVDETIRFIVDIAHLSADQRRYAERTARVRLHQPEFRGRVIQAYARRCSICDLRHPELLDAAHIVPDGQPMGQPVVPNGIALCKIHHAAYDEDLVGIDADYRVHVNESLLLEVDGPMLKHGLQEMHGRGLSLPLRPADRPDPERLSLRFEEFLRAS
jgi:putative restriction endonuclease